MNNFIKKSLFCGVLLSIGVAACKHEPIQPKNKPPVTTGGGGGGGNPPTTHPCDPDTVYFARQILPLIVSNCSMDGCHSANTRADGVVLTNYRTIRSEVDPYDPSDSDLYESLFDDDDIMPPPPRSPFTASQKALVKKWINQGAKNLTCDEGCDTSNISFAQNIKPIIRTKCTGCHSTSTPLGGVILETHAQIKASGTNGSLMGTILNKPNYNLMPPSGGKLPDCEIVKIRKWIDNGMLNN